MFHGKRWPHAGNRPAIGGWIVGEINRPSLTVGFGIAGDGYIEAVREPVAGMRTGGTGLFALQNRRNRIAGAGRPVTAGRDT